jgi:hypothetical protein
MQCVGKAVLFNIITSDALLGPTFLQSQNAVNLNECKGTRTTYIFLSSGSQTQGSVKAQWAFRGPVHYCLKFFFS